MLLPSGEGQALANSVDRRAEEKQELKAILDSPGFQKAPSVRSLLLYLWQHQGERISEYAIGTEALARRPDFDPKSDATVRVHVARLRQKLKEFYDAEGKNCPLRIAIPLGGHELEVQFKRPDEPTPDVSVFQPLKPRSRSTMLLAAVSAVLAIACLAQFVHNRKLASSVQKRSTAPPMPRFWRSFLANDKPARLFLSTPVFFEWNDTNLKLRDPQVNDFADFDNSKELRFYTKKWGAPKLLQNYTVASDTFAALKLIQYFQGHGISASFGGTAELSLDSLADHNIILLGTPGITSRHLKKVMERTNFYYPTANGATVLNRNPRRGEASRYDEIVQSDRRRTALGLIALLPGKGGRTHILTMTGRYTSPLASFLISPESLDLFESTWQKEGSPPHFELLVQVEIDGDSVLKAWPIGIRTLDVTY